MSVQGATATISAGGTTATVSFATAQTSTAYQLGFSTTWLTAITVTSKTVTGFAVAFGTPAPAGGGTFDWTADDPASSSTNVISSATRTVAAGSATDSPTVVSLPAVYQVSVAPAWVTAVDVVSKTSSGFTVNFASPAPPGGSTYDYIISATAGGVTALSDYLDELRDLLHDPDDRMWSVTQKGNYINRARKRRDIDTAVNRSTISFTLTTGVRAYTLSQVGTQIIDVFGINLIFGTYPIVLNNLSLTELTSSGFRGSTVFTGWTTAFARQGEQNVIFAPTPSQAFVTEWDCVVYLPPLVSLTDTDAVAYPYTQPVPYYAAYLAKTNEREGAQEGDWFLDKYMELVGFSTNQRVGRVPNAYSGLGVPGGWRGF